MYGIRVAAIAALASIAFAQSLPPCAATCVGVLPANCNKLDVACICGSKDWISGISCCISKMCDPQQQEDTITYANAFCAGAGVSGLPQTATCSTNVSPVYTTGSPSVSASTTSAADASTTTAANASTTSAADASTSATGSLSGSVTASVTAASSSQTTSASAAARTSGAAVMNKMNGVGMGAVLAGLVVAL